MHTRLSRRKYTVYHNEYINVEFLASQNIDGVKVKMPVKKNKCILMNL